jgi:flagellar hook assembly protein FlgD
MMATDDITSASPVWYNANAGIDDMVPIYMLAQQADRQAYKTHVVYDNGNPIVTVYPGIYNHGEIYAATHGRGIFKSDIYVGIEEMDSKESSFKSNLKLYPNPTSANLNAELDINNSKDDVIISIFDINGKLIKQENRGKNSKGLQQFKLNVNNFKPGIYIMNINIAGESISNKFVVN